MNTEAELLPCRRHSDVKTKPQEVVIAPSMLNVYATIERACITAMNACAKVHATDQIKQFKQLKTWAESQYIYCLDELEEKGVIF